MGSSNQWSSTRSVVRYQLTEDIDEWLLNFVDWLKLDINTVGCGFSDLEVKRSRGPGFESGVRDRGCALLRSPILGRNDRPVISGF